MQLVCLSNADGGHLQTDPIGYEDQFNLYAYVGNDPVNMVDFTGKQAQSAAARDAAKVVIRNRRKIAMEGGERLRGKKVRRTIRTYRKTINTRSSELKVDPNLVRSIIYEEQTHLTPFEADLEKRGYGNTVGLGQITVGTNGYTRERLLEPKTNIQAMTEIIFQISEKPLIDPERPIASIATSYNCGSCEEISEYGERVESFYENKEYE